MLSLVASQTNLIKVTYLNKSYNILNTDLTIKKLNSMFNITEIECLEDLSGSCFYATYEGIFPLFISSEVFVRQLLPRKIPQAINYTESTFVYTFGENPKLTELLVGYNTKDKTYRITYIHFKDLSKINIKRKILRVYLRMVGTGREVDLPTQLFVHRCETDWSGLVDWYKQPIYRPEPYTSAIVGSNIELSFYWDVTGIVSDWLSGALPNFGIVLKANNTYGIPTHSSFHNANGEKRANLLVYYTD